MRGFSDFVPGNSESPRRTIGARAHERYAERVFRVRRYGVGGDAVCLPYFIFKHHVK